MDQSLIHEAIQALGAICFLAALIAFVRIINSEHNELDWSQLVSTKARDGKQYADWNRIGQGLGVCLCVWLPAVYAYSTKMDAIGLTSVMGVALLYLGGVSAYASTLRSKRGGTETTTVTESSPEIRTTETKSETAS